MTRPYRLQSQAPPMPDRRLEGPGSDQRLAAIRRRFRAALKPAPPSPATLAILAAAAFIITLATGLWLTA